MPLEDILDMYPGLRKAVMENVFSADNPQSVQAVLQASANYWKEYRSSQYYIQNIESTQLADQIQNRHHSEKRQQQSIKPATNQPNYHSKPQSLILTHAKKP